jgi:hypothetical protein
VPATSAAFSKGIFGAATDSTNQRNKGGGTWHYSVNQYLDVRTLTLASVINYDRN